MPSSSPSSVTPDCEALQSLELSITHVLKKIKHHFNAIISLSSPSKVSVLGSSGIDQTIASLFSIWIDHVTSVFADLCDLIHVMDAVFSTAHDISNIALYVHMRRALTRD